MLSCDYYSCIINFTVKSFVEMTRYLLKLPDSEGIFLLIERISQDPLENFFGMQRARGGRCDNPIVQNCLTNAVAIRAQKSLQLDAVKGNCRRKRAQEEVIDSTPLPKRKRQATKKCRLASQSLTSSQHA